jgi:predicted MFS family arabinose efflux permease
MVHLNSGVGHRHKAGVTMTESKKSEPPTSASPGRAAGKPGGFVLPVALTLMVQAAVSGSVVAIPILMPVATGELNLPASYVGIFMSMIYLGSTVVAPVSGYFIDRFGPIRVSQICIGLCALGLAAVSVPAIPLMMVGAFFMGTGHGPVTPASSHLLARTTPPSIISLVFSIKQTGVPIGGALAGAIVPSLVVFFGWKLSAVWVAGAIGVLAVFLFLHRKRFDTALSGGTRLSWRDLVEPLKMNWRHPGLRRVAVASFFYSAMQLCLVSFLVTYLIGNIGMTLVQAGFLLSAAQVGGFVGRILWGVCADRCVKPCIMLGILGVAMTAGALAAAAFTPEWPYAAILAACVLFGSAAIGWNGVYLAEVARIARPGLAGVATGGSIFFNFLGILLGLPAFSLMVEWTGSYAFSFSVVAATTLICGGVLLRSARSHESDAAPEDLPGAALNGQNR